MSMTALLPVTQADREAAWTFVSRNSIAGQDREGFFRGEYDEAQAVQAFARHCIVGQAELVEALRFIAAGHGCPSALAEDTLRRTALARADTPA